MDEQLDQLPVHSKDIVSNESVELNKKRKLQYDLELPLSKHKFRDRTRNGDNAAAGETDDMQKWNKQMISRELRCDSEELGESYNDSNSVSEGYETTMTLDLDDEAEKLSGKTASPSASPSVSSTNLKMEGDFGHFSIQKVKELINTEQDMEDYDAYIKNSLEDLDGGIDDAMLYSNDVAPHAFLLSSERWINGQDARSRAKKPTIDKEFEQYFSMLML